MASKRQPARRRTIRRIGINTGGGDAPGPERRDPRRGAVRARDAAGRPSASATATTGSSCPSSTRDGGLIPLTPRAVRGHHAPRRHDPRHHQRRQPAPVPGRRSPTAASSRSTAATSPGEGLSAQPASTRWSRVGGDGSLTIANALAKQGRCASSACRRRSTTTSTRTVVTFGFDTAVSFATECIDRLHSTAASHRRVMVVEVMGRYAGWIALNAGVSGDRGRDPASRRSRTTSDKVAEKIQERYASGRGFAIVVVAEGAKPKGGAPSRDREAGGPAPSASAAPAPGSPRRSSQLTRRDTRVVVLGHLLRGGTPTTFDRLISLRFGAAAVRALAAGQVGRDGRARPADGALRPARRRHASA